MRKHARKPRPSKQPHRSSMCGAHVLCVISACKIKKMEKTSVGEHFTSSISGPTLPGCRSDDGVFSLASQVSPFDPNRSARLRALCALCVYRSPPSRHPRQTARSLPARNHPLSAPSLSRPLSFPSLFHPPSLFSPSLSPALPTLSSTSPPCGTSLMT